MTEFIKLDINKLPSKGLFYPNNTTISYRLMDYEEIVFLYDEVIGLQNSDLYIIEYKLILIFYNFIKNISNVLKLNHITIDEVLKMDIFYLFLTILDYSFNDSDILKHYIYQVDNKMLYFDYNEKCFDYKSYGYKYRPITLSSYISFINFFVVNKEEINGYFIHFLPLLKLNLEYTEMLTLDSIYTSLENKELEIIEDIVNNMKKIYRNDIIVGNISVNMEYNIIYDLIINFEKITKYKI